MTIFAGEFYVSNSNEIISTVLGSCISVCLYDPKNGVGGINHFMLPESNPGAARLYTRDLSIKEEELTEQSTRYGVTAMEVLIAEMQKKGGERKNLRAKIFGGGNVLTRTNPSLSIGDRNIGFTRAFLKMEGIKIEGENVGDKHGRKIFFLTGKNSVFVKKVALEPAEEEERKYMKKLLAIKKQGDITLF